MRQLRLLLALVLCLQSALAMAHCLRLNGSSPHQALQTVICTGEGLVTLDLGDPEDRSDAPQHAEAGFCVACHLQPGVEVPMPATVPAPRLVATLEAPLPEPAIPALGARAPPYRPTGPPLHS